MRLTRTHLFICCLLVAGIVGSVALTQMPGGRGGMGGGRGFGPPPEAIFKMYAGEAESFDVNKVEIPEMLRGFETPEKQKERMLTFLQKKGVTTGIMKKEYFGDYLQEAMAAGTKERNEKSFKAMSGDKATFNVSTVTIPQDQQRFENAETIKEKMKEFLTKKGVTTGEMTAELFSEYREARMAEFRSRWEKKDDSKPSDSKPGDSKPGDSASTDEEAKRIFKTIDTNSDGKIDEAELKNSRSQLREQRDTYDKNKNGTIEQDEFNEYWKARSQRNNRGDNKGSSDSNRTETKPNTDADRFATVTTTPTTPDARPVIFRYGKLPKELPDWFAKYDESGDKDGQVGLYEWIKGGGKSDEFAKYDLNSDGFVTAEEVILQARRASGTKMVAVSTQTNATSEKDKSDKDKSDKDKADKKGKGRGGWWGR
jgi:Ca2+-binding EF-hand superfamily protein